MKIEQIYKTSDGSEFKTVEEAVRHETGNDKIKITDYFFYDNGAFEFEDDKDSEHLFAPDGTELTEGTVGRVAFLRYYNNGTYKYFDENGYHLFSKDGANLLKDAKGMVFDCYFDEESGEWEYEDEDGEHKGVWKANKV